MNRIDERISYRSSASRTFGFAICVALQLLTAACTPKPYHAIDLHRAIARGDPIRVTMKDGRIFGLNKPIVANDSLRGTLRAKPPRDLAVPVDDVLRVERMQAIGPQRAFVLVVGMVLTYIFVDSQFPDQ